MNIKRIDKLIGSGAQAGVYSVDRKAIKVFKEHCPKSEAFCEAAIHSMVEETGLPVPKIYEVIQFENKLAIVMDLVEGASMERIVLNDLNNVSVYIDSIIDLQIKINSINAFGFPSMKDRLTRRISDSSSLNNLQKEKLQVILNSFDIGDRLCHGDFHLQNLMMTDNGMIIIDWIDATLGSPEADLCRTYMLYKLYSPNGFADMYLDIYCRKTNQSRDDILKWLPIIAGARLSEKNESERDHLFQWVDMNSLLG